uniref:Protease n=1 Tax=viral metagenome TaxID=1070528 RepID=A0A6C0KF05_9ZZZZ
MVICNSYIVIVAHAYNASNLVVVPDAQLFFFLRPDNVLCHERATGAAMLYFDNYFDPVPPIKIEGEINDKTLSTLKKKIARCVNVGQKLLMLDINSPGGDAYAALSIMELMKSCKDVEFLTVVSGLAASAAALIFACGTKGKRYMAPNGRLLIHSVQSDIGMVNMREFGEEFAEIHTLNEALCQMASEKSGNVNLLSDLVEQAGTDKYLCAPECFELGICDHLHIPCIRATTTIDVDTMDANEEQDLNRQVLKQFKKLAGAKTQANPSAHATRSRKALRRSYLKIAKRGRAHLIQRPAASR